MNHKNLDEEISIEPFNEQWRKIYQLEMKRIQEALGNQVIDTQHIGSTAIPGIDSKPIIDIMIGIQNINNTDKIIEQLVILGYEYFGEADVPGRLYFRFRKDKNYNLAVCEYKGNIWNNNILFRDYLIKHPIELKAYSNLKKKIIASDVHNLLKYSMLKQKFIEKILKKAKA